MAVFLARYQGKCVACSQPIEANRHYIQWSRRQRGSSRHVDCENPLRAPTQEEKQKEEQEDKPQNSPVPAPFQQHQQTPQELDAVAAELIKRLAREIAKEEDLANLGAIKKAFDKRLAKALPKVVKVFERQGDEAPKVTIDNAHYALADLVELINDGEHVYLYGPPGSGKSTGAVQAAKALGRRYGYVSLNPQTPESRLLGFIDAGGIYRETEFFRVFTQGGVFCIDELDNGHPALLNTLNGMLETDSDGIGRGAFPCGVVERHADFVCVATGNTNGRGADKAFPERRALDAAFLERFTFIAWGYDEAVEEAVTMSINDGAGAWLAWVRKVRAFIVENSIRGLWATPRAAFKGAARLKRGWSPAKIADTTVFKGLDRDTVTRILTACPLPTVTE